MAGIREKIAGFFRWYWSLLCHHEEQAYQTGKMELKKYDPVVRQHVIYKTKLFIKSNNFSLLVLNPAPAGFLFMLHPSSYRCVGCVQLAACFVSLPACF